MSWNQQHSLSEKLAIEAELARGRGDSHRTDELFRQAAAAEVAAFDALADDKRRTRGITAVSAVALSYKGRDYVAAERLAHKYLSSGGMPLFAESQLRNLLHMIWTTSAAERAGVRFVRGDVLVSVKGGQVIYGGAPLDLIVRKVEGIQAILFRTVELLLGRPFRKRGGPPSDIQSMLRPWLFQAAAGSYQFAVRMQEPEQLDLWPADRPEVETVTSTFFKVLRASATDPDVGLADLVPDVDYRGAFLSLARSLAPTGRTFDLLEVRDASTPAEPAVAFASDERQQLNAALRRVKPQRGPDDTEEVTRIQGTLRAVHLDQDWLEVATEDVPPLHLRIEEAGEALDDVVGPMVNRQVVITALRRGSKHLYRDIELDE